MTTLSHGPNGESLNRTSVNDIARILGVPIDTLAGWEINRVREDGAIDAYIPIDQLNVSGVPTDPNNVQRLVKLFEERASEVGGGSGQRDPIVVGHVPGDSFYVLDGFHRHEVQSLRGIGRLHSTVEPNLTFEQVVQRRLEYAHTHPEIEFARQVEWVQSAWERTPWHSLVPNVVTAFRAFEDDYAFGGSSDIGLIDSLSDRVYEEIRQWVATQSKAWNNTPAQIRENLARVEAFDRDLLPLVYKGAGVPPAGRITLKHVGAITRTYGGEVDMQKAAVAIISQQKLSVDQTEKFIDEAEKSSPITGEDLLRFAASFDFTALKPKSRESKRPGFNHFKGGLLRKEIEVVLPVSEVLEDFRSQLPKIIADANEREWDQRDIDNALEIGVTLTELLAKLTNPNL